MTVKSEQASLKAKKIWTVGQISTLTFWAGPFAGAILLSQNFKVFNEFSRAKKSLYWGFSITFVLFMILSFMPEAWMEYIHKVPKVVIPICVMLIMGEIARVTQKHQILEHLQEGKKRHSHWKVVGLIIPFILLMLAWGVGSYFAAQMIKTFLGFN